MNKSETPEPKDLEKNTNKSEVGDDIPCPYWLELIPYCFTFVFLSYISYKYLDPVPVVWKFPIFAKVLACFCVIHWCFILGERWYYFGSAGFYEIYWYCNMAMLLTSVGIILGLPSLIGQCMCLTLFPHISFWVDILLTPCMKRSPIGSAGWMFEKSTPWHERVSSLHPDPDLAGRRRRNHRGVPCSGDEFAFRFNQRDFDHLDRGLPAADPP